jgi:hypothetical protein
MRISYENTNRKTVNYLKAMYFDDPEWTPCNVGLIPATRMKYGEDLEEVVLAHPRIFSSHARGSVDFSFESIGNPLYETGRHTDCWGTVWENIERGLAGQPVESPLEDWENLEDYDPPDPLKDDMFGPRDWEAVERSLKSAKERGDLATGSPLPHGFMYMRLYYVRGFENLMMDIATDDPRLEALINMVEGYNSMVIEKYIEVGVTLLNPQFRSNGLEGLKEVAKGKVALHQDLDRQLFPIASPSEIEDHIGRVHEELNTPEGGLMLYAECEPDVPLENIDAICRALENVCNPPEPEVAGQA